MDHEVAIPQLPSRASMQHADFAKFLSKWRRKVFNEHPQLKQSILDEIEERYNAQQHSTREQRAELLKHPLFALSQSIREGERYNEEHSILRAPSMEM